MRLRWAAAGMLAAAGQFRRVAPCKFVDQRHFDRIPVRDAPRVWRF
jgi:hypothetical protein